MTHGKQSPLFKPAPHESGALHARGAARYVDDLPHPQGMLYGLVFASPVAHGEIRKLRTGKARSVPGVHAVLTAKDIPGENDISPASHDEVLLAQDTVHCVGQSVALIVAVSPEACRAAASEIDIEIEPREAVVSLRDAVRRRDFLTKPHRIKRGDVVGALDSAEVRVSGEIETGGQDHFYLETQAALAVLDEAGTIEIQSSTQHPSEVQAKVAEILAVPRRQVVVKARRMGGGFGGKETQAAHFAALAALGAQVTGRPVKVWLNRDQDMAQTGKRHPFLSEYQAGFDRDGRLIALDARCYSDGGWSQDLSQSILDRCLFHLDNAYFIPNLRFEGLVARTNLPSNTAFRGFGGPQGMAVIEEVLNRGAEALGMDPALLRQKNFYGGPGRNTTPYGQTVKDNRLERIFDELMTSSDYVARRQAIAAFNARSPYIKRGIGFQPVKFGISFTYSVLNQAGALVHLFTDGSVQLNHGGTEMGQGLHTKMLAVAAHELGVPVDAIRVMDTSTDKVPNTSATAASSGSDLNGEAVRLACKALVTRLRGVAAHELGVDDPHTLRFENGQLSAPGGRSMTFAEACEAAYLAQVSLSATGYYRTPNIHYDRDAGRGKPFHYFAYGGAVAEMEVNGLTGEHRLTRVDILHDVGNSLVPTIDIGQVEGGFIQGYGWLTCEEMVWSPDGVLKTHSPDTYKIPAISEAPLDFRVALLERAPQEDVIHGSKAVGEPPFMLALGAVTALRQAVGAFDQTSARPEIALSIPCTPEAVLRAIETTRARARKQEGLDHGANGNGSARPSGGTVRDPARAEGQEERQLANDDL